MDDEAITEVGRVLASNLRAARAARGLRLEDLAALSGVSRSMIHQIESQRTNPSVATLARLCSAFEIPINELIELPGQLGQVYHRSDGIVAQHGAHALSETVLLVADGRHELWEHHLVPADEIHDTGHPTGTRELIHVTAGNLTVDVGPATFTVAATDVLDIRADRAHVYRNDGQVPTLYSVTVIYDRARDLRYPLHPAQRLDG